MQDWYLAISTGLRGGRFGSRIGRRFCKAIPGHGGSHQTARLQPFDLGSQHGDQRSNGEVGGRSMELAEKEFILRVRGYVAEAR